MRIRDRVSHLRRAFSLRNGETVSAMAGAPGVTGHGYLDALTTTFERPYIYGAELPRDGSSQILDRRRLSQLTRWLCDNNGLVAYAIDTIANYSVPVVPQAATTDAGWNDAAELYFAEWSDQADHGRRFGFEEIQRIACASTDLDGDIAVQAVYDGGVKLVLIEAHRITTPTTFSIDPLIRDGVRLDSEGRLDAYMVTDDDRKWTPVPADQVFLWFDTDPSRPNSFRGVSPMRRGLNDVRDAKDIKGYEKLAQKIHASLAAVIEGANGIEPIVFGNTYTADDQPAVNPPPAKAPDKLRVTDLLGGTIPTLPEGQVLKPIETNRPSANAREFLDSLAASYVMGLGIPPAFFLDQRLTGPNVRAVNAKADRKFVNRQRLARRFVRWTWLRVIADAIDNKILPGGPDWWRLSFQTPPRLSIDIGGEEYSDIAAVEKGMSSLADYHAKRGRDSRRWGRAQIAERAQIIAAAQSTAESMGVPVEWLLPSFIITATGSAVVSSPVPPPEPDPTDKEDSTDDPPAEDDTGE